MYYWKSVNQCKTINQDITNTKTKIIKNTEWNKSIYFFTKIQFIFRIGRHSKSLDTKKKVCGYCHGEFELLTNKKQGLTPSTPRTPNKFAMFVKDNYDSAKKQHLGLKHKDIMRILSDEFAAKNKIGGS